jgi:hypothetical protein
MTKWLTFLSQKWYIKTCNKMLKSLYVSYSWWRIMTTHMQPFIFQPAAVFCRSHQVFNFSTRHLIFLLILVTTTTSRRQQLFCHRNFSSLQILPKLFRRNSRVAESDHQLHCVCLSICPAGCYDNYLSSQNQRLMHHFSYTKHEQWCINAEDR